MIQKKVMIMILTAALLLSAGCAGNKENTESTPAPTLPPITSEADDTLPETWAEYDPAEETEAPAESDAPAETETAAETEPETTVPETPSPNIGLTALACVPNYVNVRTGPSTQDDIVGKIYNDCAAEILDEVPGEGGNWFLITSGNVQGYIMRDFFLVGEAAEARRSEVGVLMGTVNEDYLRVRSAPDLTDPDNVFTYYELGTKVYVKELTEDGWAVIESDDASKGYVYADCMTLETVFKTAITLEEEAAEIARREAAEEAARLAEEEYQKKLKAEQEYLAAQQAAQQQQQQQNPQPAPQIISQETSDSLRNAIIAYAQQFVGNPYVSGGRSLETGTDCSGFTSLVYQHFGYSLSYTPAGQSEQGVRISVAEAQPGDLLFYSNSQKYLGHVAMYIGNGQIVHAGTPESGIFVGSAYYRDPLFAVRILP